MDRYLKAGAQIINPKRAKEGSYAIKELIGTGSSCAVYYAEFINDSSVVTEHLLKEYNPKSIKLERAENGSLVHSDSVDAAFKAGLRRFEDGYNMQLEVRRSSDAKNSTSNIQDIFVANETCYIDMTVMAGETYEKVEDKTIEDLLRRIKAITKVIGNYHEKGLLHLDIKPDNIFTIPETTELVVMFDFDSVIKKKDVADAAFLSYTQSWAAQEQILPYRRNQICEATDIFAIGEILFYKLMGRHSYPHERTTFAYYSFDGSSKLLEGVNPRIFPLLSEIFKHTICNVVGKRYQNTSELLEKLEEAILLADPRKPFLQHHLPLKASFFIGRDAELRELDERLKHTDKLFISGMGGMGKSEFVKQYAHIHKDEYDAVIFSICNSDLDSLILDDSMLPICNVQQFLDEKARDYGNRKLRELSKLCNKRVLIIVDNFNDLQDKTLSKLLQLNCKMLFTTRCDATEYNYEQLTLGTLCEEHVWDIFRTWYKGKLEGKELSAAEQILSLYQYHTMAVELIAKQMNVSCTTPTEMLEKLNAGGFSNSGRERIVHSKDGSSPKQNIYEHIRRLFDVSELRESQVYVLANLSLLPPSGIDKRQFHDWCNLESYEDINMLTESGWVRYEEKSKMISLHPVIADVMLDDTSAVAAHSTSLFSSFTHNIRDACFSAVSAEYRYHLSTVATHICNKASQINVSSKGYANFLCACAYTFSGYGYLDLFVELLDQALKTSELSTQYSMSERANLNFVLGHLLGELSDPHIAKQKYTSALQMYLQLYGEQNKYTADAYNCLGICCYDLMQFNDAKKYYMKALDIWQALFGENSKDVSDAFNNLGLLYSKLDEFEKSKHYFQKALHIKHQLYGKTHIDNAAIYCNLACLYNDQGLYEKAEEFHKRALNIRISIYGETHRDTATSLNNLGSLYSDMGSFNHAEACFLKALSILRLIYGEQHSRVATTYCNLGLLYRDFEKFENAKINIKKSLDIEKKIYGNRSCEVADTCCILGSLYLDLDDLTKSEQYYLSALDIQREVLSEMHKDTAITCNNLGSLYKKQGDFAKAEKYYKRALKIKHVVCDVDDPSIAISYRRLGDLYNQIDRLKSALECYKRATRIYRLAFGDASHESAALYFDIGRLYRNLGNKKRARKNLLVALKQSTDLYGKGHENTVLIRKEILSLSSQSM